MGKGSLLATVFGAAEAELCRRIGTSGQAGAPSHTRSPGTGVPSASAPFSPAAPRADKAEDYRCCQAEVP